MSSPRLQRRTRRAAGRRRALFAFAGLAVLAILIVLVSGGGGRAHRTTASTGPISKEVVRRGRVAMVSVTQTGTLPGPVQDAAAAATSSKSFLLLGGIASSEASVADILSVSATGATRIGSLPSALHDATASSLAGAAYLFGGGVIESFSAITRVSRSGATQPAGNLPTAASDVASAVIGDTVYIVGDYTGRRPLRTILAWRPDEPAHVMATLPKPLRYAAVAAIGGRLLIAGGTSGEVASRDVYRFDPSTRALARVGLLPAPLTHAAAAGVGSGMYVFGGRSASADGQTRRILEVGPDGSVREAGLLPHALSDMAAVALGGKVVLAGGRDSSGAAQNAILTATVSG
jgi:hypothetical protein